MRVTHVFAVAVVLGALLPANAGAQDRYVFGSGVDPSGPFQVIADQKGFFAKRGVNVSVKIYSSATAAFRSVQSGEIDAAVPGSLTPISALGQGGGGFRIVGSTRPAQNGFSAAVVSEAIKAPADLAGKKIGIAQGSPASHLWFENFAQAHKIVGINPVWLQPQEQLIAFSRGEVDALFTWRPWTDRAVQARRGARVLAYDRDIAHVNDTPITFGPRLTGKPEHARAVLRALVDADEFLQANRVEGVAIMAKVFNIPPADADDILNTVTLKVQMSDVTFKDLCATLTFLRTTGVVKQTPNWREAVDAELLRAVAPDRVTYAKFIDCS